MASDPRPTPANSALRHVKAGLLLLFLALPLLPGSACGTGDATPSHNPGPGESTPTAAAVNPASPASPAPTPRPPPAVPRALEIQVPPGFAAYMIADGFERPSSIAVDDDGRLFLSQTDSTVLRLEDIDGDGFYETHVDYVGGLEVVSGLAFSPQGELYVSSRGRISIARDTNGDGVADQVEHIIGGLPNGRHQNNGIAFGPEGKLYITNGSTCNDCEEWSERAATILRANPDGSVLEIYARGIRNAYDLVFTPDGQLWATDNGTDPPCNTIDELNLIVEGGDYGWPYRPGCNPFQPREGALPPTVPMGFNTSSDGIDYYERGPFPEEYWDNFFVAQYGQFSPLVGDPSVGKRVVRVKPVGDSYEVLDFALGFVSPLDVLVDRDGSLLVADWWGHKLYRVVYLGAPAPPQ
jgi:glucose/arabinose dehydrogenase